MRISGPTISDDWKACKSAYDHAKFTAEVANGWAGHCAQPALDELAEMAEMFKEKYGIEFNPAIPVDASVGVAADERTEVAA